MHTIRLRGFWEAAPAGGRTVHRRNFGRPRTLETGERVWLVCTSLPAPAEVRVNDHRIATTEATEPFAADITDQLVMRNVVAFAIPSDEQFGDVALEIRAESP